MKIQTNPTIKAYLLRGAFYLILLVSLCAIPFALAQRQAHDANSQNLPATTITVTNTNDSGPGSLRQALADANPGDTIDFAVTGAITLMTGELLVTKGVTINGPGTDLLAVDGNHTSGVFVINTAGAPVTISNLTISNGSASTYNIGGGIY